MKKIRVWFGNNARRPKSSANSTYVRKWNFQSVFLEYHGKEVNDLTWELCGGTKSKYISHYKQALSKITKKLSDEDKLKYTQTAIEWNEEGTPVEIQRKYVTFTCLY
jgi:hypothetical protein